LKILLPRASRAFDEERGSAVFYTLVLAPFILGLSMIVFDLSSYFALGDRLQHEADRIAYDSVLHLPNESAALWNAQLAIAELREKNISGRAELTTSVPRSIEITLSQKSSLIFALAPQSHSFSPHLTSVRRGSAMLAPRDVIVILNDGATLRPAEGDEPWGNPVEWPASAYLTGCVTTPNLPPAWMNDSQGRRWATQSCFNPAWSSLKECAGDFVRALKKLPTSRIGVIFSPGGEADKRFEILRSLQHGGGYFKASSSWGATFAEVLWRPFRNHPSLLGDEACVLFATPEQRAGGELGVADPGCRAPYSPFSNFHFDNVYFAEHLTLEEAITVRSAKLSLASTEGRFGLLPALSEALDQLSKPSSYLDHKVRGNLATRPNKSVVVITDNLGELDENLMSALLARFAREEVKLDALLFNHSWLSSDRRDSLEKTSLVLIRLAEQASAESRRKDLFTFTSVDSSEDLTRATQRLVIEGRQVVLTR
jgi:hypothetical protein